MQIIISDQHFYFYVLHNASHAINGRAELQAYSQYKALLLEPECGLKKY